jgi:hypothetical protein
MTMTPEERLAWTEVARYIRGQVAGSRELGNAQRRIEDEARESFDNIIDNGGTPEQARQAGVNRAYVVIRALKDAPK